MDAENAYIDCNKRKTKECDLLPIREAELKSILGQIAGKKDKVSKIILYDDHIDFFMTDGTEDSYPGIPQRDLLSDTFFKEDILWLLWFINCQDGKPRQTCMDM